jgi:hypothetical protein
LFARYAYPPNQLGYCGPEDASALLDTATEEGRRRIAEHARQFEGAWAYLHIIATAAGIRDPLDARVVEAYWIGNSLLDNIDPAQLVTELKHRFPGQRGATWIPGVAHHGFQVFCVYPWVGLLRRGTGNDVALSVLQQCRIRWGQVTALEGERVRVRSRPLLWENGVLALGDAREESAAWSVDGRSLLTPTAASDGRCPLQLGDLVAMHWDWVCDQLTPAQTRELETRNRDQLARVNAASHARTD